MLVRLRKPNVYTIQKFSIIDIPATYHTWVSSRWSPSYPGAAGSSALQLPRRPTRYNLDLKMWARCVDYCTCTPRVCFYADTAGRWWRWWWELWWPAVRTSSSSSCGGSSYRRWPGCCSRWVCRRGCDCCHLKFSASVARPRRRCRRSSDRAPYLVFEVVYASSALCLMDDDR